MVGGLAPEEPGLLVDVQGPLVVVDGRAQLAEIAVHGAEVVEAARLAFPPTAATGEVERPVVVVDGLIGSLLAPLQLPEAQLGGGLTAQVTAHRGGGKAGLCGDLPVGERPAQREV